MDAGARDDKLRSRRLRLRPRPQPAAHTELDRPEQHGLHHIWSGRCSAEPLHRQQRGHHQRGLQRGTGLFQVDLRLRHLDDSQRQRPLRFLRPGR